VVLDDENLIAGYYTFAATSLPLTELSPEETRRFAGQRVGGALIMDAAARAVRLEPAIYALIVDAKDEAAAAFYAHLQFRPFASRPLSLFLPIATALRAMGAPK
jgi:hypothetical protein